jgi:choline kinase
MNHKCKQAIVLAAGYGSRLNSEIPKSLHVFNNKTILDYNIEQLIRYGFEDIIVVGGYKINLLRNILQKYSGITLLENKDYLTTGTTNTISKALPYIKDCFMLIEADFLCEDRGLYELSTTSSNSFITTPYSNYGDEAVAVFSNGRFIDVSKDPKYRESLQQVPEYCSPSHLTKNMASLMVEYDKKNGGNLNYYSTMAPVIEESNISISMIYIPKFRWSDIDFKEDIPKMQKYIDSINNL